VRGTLQAAAGANLCLLLRSLGDGKVGILGSLGTPNEDSSTTESNESLEVFTAGEATGSTLKELRLEAIVTVLLVLTIHVPAANGVFEVLQVEITNIMLILIL
jgi:hypothetical protein